MYNTPEFQALRREYLQGAAERADHLQEQVTALRQGDEVDLRQLRQEIHKLRGSGGFYGFRALSDAAAKAEDHVILTLDDEIERDDQRIADLVEQLVQEIAGAVAQQA